MSVRSELDRKFRENYKGDEILALEVNMSDGSATSSEQAGRDAAIAAESARRAAFDAWVERDKESIRAKTKVGMSTEYALWDAFVAGWDAAQAADVWE